MAGNGETGPQAIPPLVIRVRPDGKGVHVQGPILNKLLCWQMLTDAAKAILHHEEASGLVIPDVVPPKDPLKLP